MERSLEWDCEIDFTEHPKKDYKPHTHEDY